jgi:hypothetical protein
MASKTIKARKGTTKVTKATKGTSPVSKSEARGVPGQGRGRR